MSALIAAQIPPPTDMLRIGLIVKYWNTMPSSHAAMKSQR